MQSTANTQATGHVDDEANLDSYDLQSTSSLARQPGLNNPNGIPNQFVEANFTIHASTSDPSSTTIGNLDFTRASSQADWNFAGDMARIMVVLNVMMTSVAFMMAEMQWKGGYCLDVTVPEPGSGTKTVEPNSETRFTANVRHKFEGAELPLPVIATLTGGQVSVAPAGTKVPAPAAFTYTAPDQPGQTATVGLETRSKRGIAKLELKFNTKLPAWSGEGQYHTIGQNNGIEVKEDYAFSITLHILSDGTIEGGGELTKAGASYGGFGMTCTPVGIAALNFPPLEVTGRVKQDGSLYIAIQSHPSTNTWHYECASSAGGSFPLDQGTDPGIGLFEVSIVAEDGAQTSENQAQPGGGGVSGGYSWEFQIHKDPTP